MSAKILENLRKAVVEYNAEGAARWARKSIEEGMDAIEVADALTEAVRQIGDGYSRGEFWLPDLVGAGEAMQSAMPIIQEEIRKGGGKVKTAGTVVIGTVYGDIHSIGETMVSTLLTVEGFEVHDLGTNVTVGQFIEAVKKHKADILAMSALMSMTVPEQEKVICTLKTEGLSGKVKVMVGGGAVTEEFAASIGADGYGATAVEAPKIAKRLMQ